MAGNKPELKIAIKPVDGGERVSLFAFWRRDNGKLSGSLDRRVKGIRVVLEDGSHVDLRRVDGKHTHWIDCFEESDGGGGPRSGGYSGGGGSRHGDDFPADDGGADWGSDDVPFLERDGRLP